MVKKCRKDEMCAEKRSLARLLVSESGNDEVVCIKKKEKNRKQKMGLQNERSIGHVKCGLLQPSHSRPATNRSSRSSKMHAATHRIFTTPGRRHGGWLEPVEQLILQN
jgi:hypothetical protein